MKETSFPGLRGIMLCAIVAACVGLAGCATDESAYVERPVEDLYNGAIEALADNNFEAAVRQFDEVERQHPYSVWATKAQMMAAYAQYQGGNYDDAILAADRFIQLHPGNQDISYAYYLRALCHYEQISQVSRDQRTTRLAREALEEVTRRFPNSDYARDARLKLDLVNDHLAGKEMEIGRYYLQRGHYLAAINRFRNVVEQFQTTSHVEEALHRLTEAYTVLGIEGEARQNAAVMGHNYPGSLWYLDTYQVVGGAGADDEVAAEKQGFFIRLWPF